MPDSSKELLEAITSFWDTVPSTWRIVRKEVHKTASQDFGISGEQFHILRMINKGEQCMGDLSTDLRVTRPAVTQAVDELVVKGLILRKQDKNDRRIIRLEMTPAGEQLLGQLFAKNRAWLADKLKDVPPEDLAELVRALNTLKNHIKK
jgi:MarR family transcriptional regulator, organic hydroperoxide resistance regulator